MSGHDPMEARDTMDSHDEMVITGRTRFWMGFWPLQLVRFVVLNLKILKGVNAAKRS